MYKNKTYSFAYEELNRTQSHYQSWLDKIKYQIGFVVICASFLMYFYWMGLEHTRNNTIYERTQPIKVNTSAENNKKIEYYPEFGPKNTNVSTAPKYILLWSRPDNFPFRNFEEGQFSFIKNNCSATNCYFTTNKTLLEGDITKFHAVVFDGRSLSAEGLPSKRSSHQKYIFFNMESSDNIPVCNEKFDGFFNWTATYKLNSDIPIPYMSIINNEGQIVGPKNEMQWPLFTEADDKPPFRMWNKTKAAAWFVSHCKTRSGREKVVKQLQNVLKTYGLNVDIYGKCGPLKCPRSEAQRCNALLDKDYFFYLSFENAFSDDYVTEKLITSLHHNTIPIVYGAANYSKFLPPGSYLDLTKMEVSKLASTMNELINNQEKYNKFFRWKQHYTYNQPGSKGIICAVCAALNNKEKFEKNMVHDHFRRWWNSNYKQRCI